MEYKLSDLIDIDKNQRLLDSFCDSVGIAAAIIDLKGEVLVGSRWQRICTDFHRVNERTCEKCIESDTQLANELKQGERFSIYQCQNGLTDAASPVIIEDEHIANAFVGQFFLKTPDHEFFLRQAATYGFEETAYLDALSEVPIVTEENLPAILNFLTTFAEMVAKMGLDQIRQTEAGKALRKSEERFRTAFENAATGIALMANNGYFMRVNQTLCKILGYSEEELLSKTWVEITEPDDLPSCYDWLKRVKAGEQSSHEKRFIHKLGHPVWIEVSSSLVRDSQDRIQYYISLFQDIMSRKQAEEALWESKDKYRSIYENIQDVYYETSLDGVILEVSPSIESISKYKREELIGKSLYDIYTNPDQRDELIKVVLAGEKVSDFEINLTDKDGSQKPCSINTLLIVDEQGNPLKFVGSMRDIAERKQAEDKLKAAEKNLRQQYKFLQTLIDAIPVPVFYKDTKGIYQGCNREFTDFIGLNKEEIVGRGVFDIFPKDSAAVYHDSDIQLLKNTFVQRYENKTPHANGTLHDVIDCKATYFDDQGRVAGIIGAMLDITDRKRAEEALRESEARLQQAHKMESIGTLAGGIAHDFNNVLYSIIGYTELTMDDMPEGSLAQSNLKEVFKGAMRAKDMVQQILAFSRKARTEKKPIKVQSIVKEALKLLKTSIPSTIEIHPNIDENCGPVLADSTQIHQVVVNLATNAYQAMRGKGGLLKLTLKEEQIGSDDSDLNLDPGTYLKLTVSDTGHGMDKAVMGKIFDPYFSTKGPGEGSGMGLAVVHGITKDHSGDIKVYSKLGEGTAFSVYLPLIETRTVERETISTEPVLTGTERILFVDDEEPIVFMAQQILERLGYQITSRTSSVEALEAFRAKPDEFDLVITDLTMPNMTGVELAPKLLEINPNIPVIICTGFSELVDEDKAKAVGICEYVMKPIVKDQIARTVRKVLDEGKEK